MILITGGAASGKSAHAERILCQKTARNRLYLATMQPFGEEAQARIDRHHVLRAGRGFETVERYHDIAGVSLPKRYDGILLEDLGNLLANELYAPEGAGEHAFQSILEGVTQLRKCCETLVLVSNEVFADGVSYDADTMRYIHTLGALHTELARAADIVAESVCGILVPMKGGNQL